MAGDPLGQVKPGDPFPTSSRTWNALLETARRVRGGFAGPSSSPAPIDTSPVLVNVRNDTGSDVARYGIVRPDDLLISEATNSEYFKNSPFVIKGKSPTAAGNIAIMLESTKGTGVDKRIGRAVIAGLVQCQVNVTNSSHGFARPIAGDSAKLVSDAGTGVPIIHKPTGTGVKWCVVLLTSQQKPTRRAFGIYDHDGTFNPVPLFPMITRTNTTASSTSGYGWKALALRGDLPLQNDTDALRFTEDIYLHGVAEMHLHIQFTAVTGFHVDFWTLTNAITHRLGNLQNGLQTNWFARHFGTSTTGYYYVVLRSEFWGSFSTQSWLKAILHVAGSVPSGSNVIYCTPKLYTLHLEEITAGQFNNEIASTGNAGSSPLSIGTGDSLTTGSNTITGSGTFLV